jgi:MFS transporter, DHA2 family, multidrug resistance protein
MAAATMPLTLGAAKKDQAINPWLIAITVTLETFIELLDTAIANVSLPHIAGGPATSDDEAAWVRSHLDSYLEKEIRARRPRSRSSTLRQERTNHQ